MLAKQSYWRIFYLLKKLRKSRISLLPDFMTWITQHIKQTWDLSWVCKYHKHLAAKNYRNIALHTFDSTFNKKRRTKYILKEMSVNTNIHHQENQEESPTYQYLARYPVQWSIQPKTDGHRDLGHSYAPSAME